MALAHRWGIGFVVKARLPFVFARWNKNLRERLMQRHPHPAMNASKTKD